MIPLWLKRAADLAESDLVKRHAYGEWPVTESMLRHLATKLCVALCEEPDLPVSAMFFNDRILYRRHADWKQTYSRIIHEVVEASLRRGDLPDAIAGRPPSAPHLVAQELERRYLRALGWIEAMRQDALQREARDEAERAAQLVDLTCERDEAMEQVERAFRPRRRRRMTER